MEQDQKPESAVVEELSKLGRQVAEALRMAWESDERKNLQAEIEDGARKFGDQLATLARKASESEVTTKAKVQAERVAEKVKESTPVDDIREGLVSGLKTLNRELGKLVEKLGEKTEDGEPSVSGEAVDEPVEGETGS